MAGAYYNEHEPKAAAWLRELIRAGHLPEGEVDERSIVDVAAHELRGFTQHHFFAGIGGWPAALRRAGWSDDRPVVTGSCPCQPFSCAGKASGFEDHRHLWPEFFRIIRGLRPDVVFGEQVASKDGLAWIDLVRDDMEGENYALAAFDISAAGFGAPHIRQRLYFVGMVDANNARLERWREPECERPHKRIARPRGVVGRMADGNDGRCEGIGGFWLWGQYLHDLDRRRAGGGMGNTARIGRAIWCRPEHPQRAIVGDDGGVDSRWPGATDVGWANPDWLFCRDGKWRPVEPGSSALAHGVSGRVWLLRGYGNAIVLPQAAAFIEAVMEVLA